MVIEWSQRFNGHRMVVEIQWLQKGRRASMVKEWSQSFNGHRMVVELQWSQNGRRVSMVIEWSQPPRWSAHGRGRNNQWSKAQRFPRPSLPATCLTLNPGLWDALRHGLWNTEHWDTQGRIHTYGLYTAYRNGHNFVCDNLLLSQLQFSNNKSEKMCMCMKIRKLE